MTKPSEDEEAEALLEAEERELMEQSGATEGEGDPLEELRARRERLPETAMALMEAIREAAVSRKLTRQITRLLIVATEFLSSEHPVSGDGQQAAAQALAEAEALLQRAVQKQWFSHEAQADLADRIRKQRKGLEKALGQARKTEAEEGA